MGFGLPTPRLITTIGPYFEIKTFDEFQKFLSGCIQDIAIKPVSSKGGQNVLILTYRDRRFHMLDEQYTPEMIWQHMQADMKKGFLVEEKMSNNRQLADIYPHSLNCFRITTIKLCDRWIEMLPPYLKVGHGKSVVDNIFSGGILVFLDKNGHSKMACAEDVQKEITHHPDTGTPLVGIRFDRVEEVIELGLKASHKFGFMGTIGWDIGLTEVGPVIIEGNGLWGGWEDQKIMGGFITDEMTQHLKKHTFLSRWDRKRMFPHFNRKMKAFRE